MSADLTELIEDAVSDAQMPLEDSPDLTAPSTTEAVEAAPEATEAPTEPSTTEVTSPAAKTAAPEDDFAKKFGLPASTDSGRENRLPYSRVKKIVEKAEKDREEKLRKELDFTPKQTEYETKIKDYETRLTDYEGRLQRVADFEQVLLNDPNRFLGMLNQIPIYNQIFSQLVPSGGGQQAGTPSPTDMPQPDQKLEDGTMVYSMEGLQALLAWQASQVEDRVTKQVAARYAPIESEWQQHQYMSKLIPQVQAQIETARKWPLFNENEEEITKALQSDANLSLEGAYRQVVFPKITSDRNKLREELLTEIKKAPAPATSAPTKSTKPSSLAAPTSTTGNKLEDIITAQVEAFKNNQ